MLLDSHVLIKWVTINKEWYADKGYNFTKIGDNFLVEINDVIPNSKAPINFKCDYCEEDFIRRFGVWQRSVATSPIKKDACKKCVGIKRKEANLIIHGVENVMHIEEVKEKLYQTNIERYGVPIPLKNEDIKKKMASTNNIRYGGKTPASSKAVIDKIQKTTLERYGNVCYLQSAEGKIKIDNINLERYGTTNPTQLPKIREKALSTLYRNGDMPTSSQQLHIHSLVNGELNYLFGRSFLDIAFTEDKIYLEYDGGGHNLSVKLGNVSQEEFDKKERRRSFFLKDNGWKEIRIISDDDKLPPDKTIKDFVEIAKSFLIADKWFSVHWNTDEAFMQVNYKHIYNPEDFFKEFSSKEAM